MENLVTTETIIEWLTSQVQTKQPIDPATWLDAAQKLNVLLQGEQEKLFDKEQEIAKIRNISIDAGESVAKARSRVEETDEAKEMKKQKAKVERILEMIRIAKLQARISQDIYKAN